MKAASSLNLFLRWMVPRAYYLCMGLTIAFLLRRESWWWAGFLFVVAIGVMPVWEASARIVAWREFNLESQSVQRVPVVRYFPKDSGEQSVRVVVVFPEGWSFVQCDRWLFDAGVHDTGEWNMRTGWNVHQWLYCSDQPEAEKLAESLKEKPFLRE